MWHISECWGVSAGNPRFGCTLTQGFSHSSSSTRSSCLYVVAFDLAFLNVNVYCCMSVENSLISICDPAGLVTPDGVACVAHFWYSLIWYEHTYVTVTLCQHAYT